MASLVLIYWPFGPVLSLCTGPLGQFGPDIFGVTPFFDVPKIEHRRFLAFP